ncbi:hypothetical protein SAMN06265338_1182 [Rhodoblastus acidophilus]|uniref:Uncharacterized protein n=1 Tax=Rhodoblastus acidophilus TaxID=1074 RepID=A0A212S9L0_RHOAC|nr:hypothetical protein [Rhodoblastus acidophilus]PPQ36078.1 hypothetical protein CKO16_19050 [Rhodoblastus acidophilus]RAI18775.1 hypothetical protein CH337_13495 [Rhodoblastus acidophilus]SNB82087.1 hypothetical protein SAMN06265338_1182 [Rhodoblastus acidophilus]
MTDDTQATAPTSDVEPTTVTTPSETVETSTTTAPVKTRRAARGGAKATKPAKTTSERKGAKAKQAVTPVSEEINEPVAMPTKKRSPVRAAKAAKPAKVTDTVEAPTAVKSGRGKRAKPEKASRLAKVVNAASKRTKAAAAVAAKKPAATGSRGRSDTARYTTNELNSAARKAGLIIEFTPTVAKPASIGRGPAKEFKVDVIVANLRGSNGDLIRDRGPGTPLHNDAESLAAVEIFEKFRGRTFHNKLKVEIF